MDIDILRQAVTVVSFVAFLAVVAYAVHPGNKRRFEEAANVPFEGDPLPNPLPGEREQTPEASSRVRASNYE